MIDGHPQTERELLLNLLEGVMSRKKPYQEAIASLETQEKEYRDKLLGLMTQDGVRSQESPNKGILASVVTRKDIRLVDEVIVKDYLKSNGLLEECLRLDLTIAKRYAKKMDMPGWETIETTTISIRPAKEEVEQIVPEETPQQFRDRIRGEQ